MSGPTAEDAPGYGVAAPLLHMTVPDIVSHLGLPSLPAVPEFPAVSEFSPLPALDISMLMEPLIRLLAGFGSGNVAAASYDPTKIFDGIVHAFESTVQLSSQAMSALMPLWTGPAASQAMATAAQAKVQGAQLSGQSGSISVQVRAAAAVVARGAALLEAIVGRFITIVTPLLPTIVTPAGQITVVGIAAEHLAEGLAVVAETRAELTAHTAAMVATAQPVIVAAAPQLAAEVSGAANAMVRAAARHGRDDHSLSDHYSRGDHYRVGRELRSREEDIVDHRDDMSPSGSEIAGIGAGYGVVRPSSSALHNRGPGSSFAADTGRIATEGANKDDAVVCRTSASIQSTDAIPPGGAGIAPAPVQGQHSSARHHLSTSKSRPDHIGDCPADVPRVVGVSEGDVRMSHDSEPSDHMVR